MTKDKFEKIENALLEVIEESVEIEGAALAHCNEITSAAHCLIELEINKNLMSSSS